MTEHRAYIGIGSNLGDRDQTLGDAFDALDRIALTRVVARSSIYVTEPIAPTGEQQDYFNAVAALDTALAPKSLLDAMHAIEQNAGRTRQHAVRNTARTLDLDLLLYDDRTIDEPGLSVPHPRLADRAFVLVPLTEIAPACLIPGLGAARALLDRVAGQRIVRLPRRHSVPADRADRADHADHADPCGAGASSSSQRSSGT